MSTAVAYDNGAQRVLVGDCIEVMRTLPDESIDAIVTDPPYGLGFMGQAWDALPPGREWADECLRLLVPGGHLVAFGGTRTWHRLAVAIEDAGFEIRDSLAWMYGSGFPKSLDVSKAIDKRRDDTVDVRVVCRWLRARIDEHPAESIRTIADRFGFHPRMVEHWAARDTDSQPSLPTLTQWDALRSVLGFADELDAEVLRLNLRKGEPGEAWADREVTGQVAEWTDRVNYALTSRDGLRRDVASSDDARAWQGWGTALKPAFEPIVFGRKPLAGTVAANVLLHGTGALNIDGCRVAAQDSQLAAKYASVQNAGPPVRSVYGADNRSRAGSEPHTAGRWPPNVILDESQAAELDEQSGGCRFGAPLSSRDQRDASTEVASRFFYTAKAGNDERVQVDGVAHTTVKPLAVMRWLARLVTPSGGTVLDTFAGSGTTAEACLLEGFPCIVIERETEFVPLIVQRLNRRLSPVAAVRGAGQEGGLFDLLDEESGTPTEVTA